MENPKIDLDKIIIEPFPENPTCILRHEPGKIRYDYKLSGFFNENEIGHLTISLMHHLENLRKRDNFWFDLSKKPPVIRPFVFFQKTEEAYRGQGVSGRLIVLANELSKIKFGQPLYSSISFVPNYFPIWDKKPKFEQPGKRVWEKLERDGLAKSCPYHGKPRWVMI